MNYRYSVETDQEVTFSSSQPGAPIPPGMRFQISGEWNVGIVSAGEAQVEAQVRLVPANVSVSVDGKDALAPEVRQTMMKSLTMPFFMTLQRSGAVKWVHFEMGTDVLAQGILRSLVATSQFVVTGVPPESWRSEEYDVTGQYQATYQRAPGQKQFEKTKQGYTHVATSKGLQPYEAGTLRIDVHSRSTFGLAEDGWAETMQAQERLEVDAGQGMPKVTNQLQCRLRLLARTRDLSLLSALEARRASLNTILLASYQAQTQDPKENYRRILAGKHFDDLLKDLRSLPKEERARDDARSLALEQLRALFMLEPTEALKVPETLRQGGLEPIAASPLLGALSAASTPESIQALSKVVDDSVLEVPVRTDAVAALGMADAPTQEGINALRNLTREPRPELRDTATLALGNAAYQMHDENARGSEALVRELETAYRSAKTPEEQAMILRALGNTRDAHALTTLQNALGSTSVQVRQAAVTSLRLIPDPAADRLLAARLLGDESPDVRKAAVFASSFRPLEPLLPTLRQALQQDPAAAVRTEIVHVLGGHLTQLPGARELLNWSSQNDANPAIRQLAARFLGNAVGQALP
ncbi:HEAT repeat domain-containing protein [Cystobacter fuscus]|uniref:HEAT repeat domain-containing protein n=1 Tax=Cystobacter fuscus TaxID=43 RepID=UPI0037BFEEDA